jgi:glutamate--cysteine ligase
LQRRGVKYIEVRSLDLNLFNPLGIDSNTGYFIEAFLLTCLFQDSPNNGQQDQAINNKNQLCVAHEGRKPGLMLSNRDHKIPLKDWAHSILNAMAPICQALDNETEGSPYQTALNQHRQSIDNPDLTPSAQVLRSMRESELPFARFAMVKTREHAQAIKAQALSTEVTEKFRQYAEQSHQQQIQIEKNDKVPFDTFLEHYFAQT